MSPGNPFAGPGTFAKSSHIGNHTLPGSHTGIPIPDIPSPNGKGFRYIPEIAFQKPEISIPAPIYSLRKKTLFEILLTT
jgi:hypothetical protein